VLLDALFVALALVYMTISALIGTGSSRRPLDREPGRCRGVVGDSVKTMGKVGYFLFLASMLLAALSLIVRLVRARGRSVSSSSGSRSPRP
jgi:hypothetical protein